MDSITECNVLVECQENFLTCCHPTFQHNITDFHSQKMTCIFINYFDQIEIEKNSLMIPHLLIKWLIHRQFRRFFGETSFNCKIWLTVWFLILSYGTTSGPGALVSQIRKMGKNKLLYGKRPIFTSGVLKLTCIVLFTNKIGLTLAFTWNVSLYYQYGSI